MGRVPPSAPLLTHGSWPDVPSNEFVPGDVVGLKLGDMTGVVPLVGMRTYVGTTSQMIRRQLDLLARGGRCATRGEARPASGDPETTAADERPTLVPPGSASRGGSSAGAPGSGPASA